MDAIDVLLQELKKKDLTPFEASNLKGILTRDKNCKTKESLMFTNYEGREFTHIVKVYEYKRLSDEIVYVMFVFSGKNQMATEDSLDETAIAFFKHPPLIQAPAAGKDRPCFLLLRAALEDAYYQRVVKTKTNIHELQGEFRFDRYSNALDILSEAIEKQK